MNSRTAVCALIACVVIATATAALIVRISANMIDETAAVQAAEAPEIARLYVAKYGSLAKSAPSIIARITRDGLHVSIFDDVTHTIYTSRGQRPMYRPAGEMHGPGPFGSRPEFPDRPGPDGPGGPGNPPPPGFDGGTFGGPAALPLGTPGPEPRGEPGSFPDGFNAPWHADLMRFLVARYAGLNVVRVRIPGGWIAIIPGTDRVLAVVRTVMLGLALVIFASGMLLWLYVRGVRRAALRPLLETTLALQRLALRDFSPRTIMAGGGGAYDELARAYNAAVEAVSSAFAERRAAEAEMQRFIADAGHELRTPLTIVMGYLDIIDGGALADPKVAFRITGGMRTEAVRMRKLIDKLIVLARMETPSDSDARTNFDVVSLVARVIESLEPLATQPMEVSGVPFAHAFANEDDVADALINVVENALKYAPLSPVAIGVERSDGQIVIEIADRGPGMTADEQRGAFERFYRGDKRDVSGSGLGLAIAKRAVERAGGTIVLHSIEGSGTTVAISLPEAPLALDDARRPHLAHR